jgi:hypothetical protein
LVIYFEGTRSLAALMRFTGQENKGECAKALRDGRCLWGKLKNAVNPGRAGQDLPE